MSASNHYSADHLAKISLTFLFLTWVGKCVSYREFLSPRTFATLYPKNTTTKTKWG